MQAIISHNMVNPILSGHSKIDRTKFLKTGGSNWCRSKVLQNAPREHPAILLNCIKRLLVLKAFLGLLLSDSLRQV